jgi:uncharacterized protein with HEPN domain
MYLWDMQQAASLIAQFTANRDFEDYLTDPMCHAAVERQFEIIGEAMSRLAKLDPALAAQIPEHQGIIGLRNRLIHAYAIIDDGLVWGIIQEKLPILRRELEALLSEP